jgi:hypothetical protein
MNSFEVMLSCLEFGYPMNKSAKAPSYPSSKASEECTANLLTKSAVVSAFKQFELEFGEHKCLPISQAFGNQIYLGSKGALELLSPF